MDKKSKIEITIGLLVVVGGAFAFAYDKWFLPVISQEYVNINNKVTIVSKFKDAVVLNAVLNIANNSNKPITIQSAWVNVHGEMISSNNKATSFNELVLESYNNKTKNGVNKFYDFEDAGLIYSGRYEDDNEWSLEAGEKVSYNKVIVVPTTYDVSLFRSELLFTEQGKEMTLSWKSTNDLIHPVFNTTDGVNYKMTETRVVINGK